MDRERSTRRQGSCETFVSRSRDEGRIRWYNGRRQVGMIDCDDGRTFFVPVGGAVNKNLVPATAGGLFHGTRVSFKPVDDAQAGTNIGCSCVDVRPEEPAPGQPPQPGIQVGVETRIGRRPYNEDRLIANDLFDLGFLSGVFDGHGGSKCVDYVTAIFAGLLHSAYAARASNRIGGVLSLTVGQEEDLISDSLRDAFAQADAKYVEVARRDGNRDGSTGLVVLLAHGFEAPQLASSLKGVQGGVAKLFVANCGDCRAILLRRRKALRLSEDHKPEREDELIRIQQAGGVVIHTGGGTHRVGRKSGLEDGHSIFLSTSRSFGDLELKYPKPLVIGEPDILIHTLAPEDWAVVLACDGVWGAMSDEDVANEVWDAMVFRKLDPVAAARQVADKAEAMGSKDNVTVMVLRFGWSKPPKTMT